MRPLPVLGALLVMISAIGVVAWMSQPIKTTPELPYESQNPFAEDLASGETTSGKPQAVLVEELHDFGDMRMGDTGEHTFVIRNDGDAVLKLEKGPIECKCTIPTLTKTELAPGELSEIVMSWKPLSPTDEFVKAATIWTNDPDNPAVHLRIRGQVRTIVDVVPAEVWMLGTIKEDEPTEIEGRIGSQFAEQFEIKELQASREDITTEFVALTPEELEEGGYKAGYKVTCRVHPTIPVGRISEHLKILTDLSGAEELSVSIEGNRAGPFSILGQNWDGPRMLLRMGDVQADDGKEITLSVFTPREADPLQILSSEVDPPFLNVELQRDETFKVPTKERYLLTFAIPKGSPVGLYKDDKVAKAKLKTNREGCEEINLNVEFHLQ